MTWALASVKDRYDNQVNYTYANFGNLSTHVMEWLPTQIRYTSRPGVAGDRLVFFDWGDEETQVRADVRTSFVSGLAQQNTMLLRSILVRGPDPVAESQLRQYKLRYDDLPGQHALMTSVTECDRTQVCKPATTFEWTPIVEGFTRHDTSLTDVWDEIVPADINGDGMDDILYRSPPSPPGPFPWFFRLANGNPTGSDGFGARVQINYPGQDLNPNPNFVAHGGRAADIDADGLADFLLPVSGSGTFHKAFQSLGNGFVPFADPVVDAVGGLSFAPTYIGDFTGDGLPDLMRSYMYDPEGRFAWAIRKNDPITSLGPFQIYNFNPPGETDSHYVDSTEGWNAYAVDIDGDGKLELLYRQATGALSSPTVVGNRMIALANPGVPISPAPRVLSLLGSERKAASLHYQMLDVNGDGLPDAVGIPNAGGDFTVAINNGRDFLPPVSITLPAIAKLGQSMDTMIDDVGASIDPGLRVGDFDGDGRADMLLMDDGCYNVSFGPRVTSRSQVTVLHSRPGPSFPAAGFEFMPIGVSGNDYNDIPAGTATTCSGGYPTSRVLDLNGDGLPDVAQLKDGGTLVLYTHQGQKPGLLKRVTDGLNKHTEIQYKPITDPSVHTRSQCSYPLNCSPRGMWLVSQHTVDTGGTPATYQHTYSGGKSDLRGLGWLGMDEHVETDMTTGVAGVVVHTRYDHTFPDPSGANILATPGIPTQREIDAPVEGGQATVSRLWTTHYQATAMNNNTRVVATPDHSSFSEVEVRTIGGVPNISDMRSWSKNTTYNQQYGYLTSSQTTRGSSPGDTESVVLDFFDDNPTEWLVGQIRSQTDTYTTAARNVTTPTGTLTIPLEAQTRKTAFTYESTGAVKTVTVEPDSTDVALHLVTEYVRNAAGQVFRTTATRLDGVVRETIVDSFDPVSGIYPYETRNALKRKRPSFTMPASGK